jgi:catechol 2,3-dioxygenase-like lactoylglutathione lyase family enzyme
MRVAVPVLPCRDVQAARSYFTDALGFDTIFTWETPPSYAAVIRDTAEFHLYAESTSCAPAAPTSSSHWLTGPTGCATSTYGHPMGTC